MKVVVGKKPLMRILKWTQRTLFAAALLLLGYCGFALVDAWIFQARASRDLDRQLRDRRAANREYASTAVPHRREGCACRHGGRSDRPH